MSINISCQTLPTPHLSLQGIAKGVATRIRRLCSDKTDYKEVSIYCHQKLVDRCYNIDFIANEFSSVAKIHRKAALGLKPKKHKDISAWVVVYKPRLPSLNKFISNSIDKLYQDEKCTNAFHKVLY